MKKAFSFLLFFVFLFFSCQKQITVINSNNGQPISNAKISCNDELLGKTDQEGILKFRTKCKSVNVSAEGFYDEKYIVEKSIIAELSVIEKGVQKIETVIIQDKSDPFALAILKKANDFYERNSPKSLDAYEYKSYDKVSIDMDKDSINIYQEYIDKRVDSLKQIQPIAQKKKEKKDSLEGVKLMEMMKESQFLLWERASEFLYSKQHGEKINILDNRISGFQNPIYEMLALRTNRNRIPSIVNKENEKLYRYYFSDSIDIGGRKTYVIKYREARKQRPDERQKFNGYIYIDAETYGIKKIESNSRKKNEGEVISIWKPIDEKWFLEKEFIKLKMGSISFDEPTEKKEKENQNERDKKEETEKIKQKEFGNYVTLSSDYFDFETNNERNKNDYKGYSLSIKNSDGQLLEKYRTNPLTERELGTYKNIDSLGQKYKIDQRVQILTTLLRGKLRLGIVDLDLGKIIKINKYENVRLGAGFKLNERFNKYISPDVYFGYGFKDGTWKYGAGIDVRTTLRKHSIFRLEYANDMDAAGNFNRSMWDFKMQIANTGINLNNGNFYHYEGFKLSYETDFGDALTMKFGARREDESAQFNYDFNGLGNDFTNFSTLVSLRYSPRSKSMMTPTGKYTFDSQFPQLYINYEQGLKTLGGDFNFSRWDLVYLNHHKTKLGTTAYRIYGGITSGKTPIWHQFTMNGLSNDRGKLNFNLTSFLGFATMEAGKYYGDRFAGLYISHRIPWYFKTLGNNISSLDMVYRTAISDMKNPEYHQFSFNKMDRLYQEVGVEWNNFLSTRYNLGFFYRVGHYQTSRFIDNFAIQLKFIALEF